MSEIAQTVTQPPRVPTGTPVANPQHACDGCGAFGAFEFDGTWLCVDCYAERGSCCSAEFPESGCYAGDDA